MSNIKIAKSKITTTNILCFKKKLSKANLNSHNQDGIDELENNTSELSLNENLNSFVNESVATQFKKATDTAFMAVLEIDLNESKLKMRNLKG